jgi:lipoprotein-anchoring transpeptidase ErfK/SrfK
MGIYEGAGIHGTAEVESHGCVRLASADVEELYDLVEVGTPIYAG